MNPLKLLDDFLNGLTMYRLLWYGLRVLIAIAVVFCFTGVLSFSWGGLLVSVLLLVAVCWAVNWLLAWVYKAPANSESSIITALILTCILPQTTSVSLGVKVALVGMIAIASKYVLGWHHKHLFNPAALGAAICAWLGITYATWWIGNPYMLPFVAILGLLVLRKIHRLTMFGMFAAAALAMGAFVAAVNGQAIVPSLHSMIASGPLVFLGAIMLTEPSTAPGRRYYQLLYGLLVGALFATQLNHLSPQAALLIGNLLAFAVNLKRRLSMTLVRKQSVGPQLYEFAFQPDSPFEFVPGQYLEWTLPPAGGGDIRGNRRTFSIASAPTDKLVHIGIKIPAEKASKFKTSLGALRPGDTVVAGQLAGDFCLPADAARSVVWIAGGIGITPYVSMARWLIATGQRRHIKLFYSAADSNSFAFREVFEAARPAGVAPVFTTERLTAEQVIGSDDPVYFVSGPPPMVTAYKALLRQNHVPRRRIITDTFTGY